jgi:hypothetical protein
VLYEITLAHELDHALEDQRFRVDSRVLARGGDRGLAYLALIEGSATALMERYAERRFSPEELIAGAAVSAFAGTGDLPPFLTAQLLFSYTGGERFVARLLELGGGRWTVVDAALRFRPPASTEQILHPDKYRAHEKPAAVSVPDLSGSLGQGWRQINQNTLGEMAIRLMLEEYVDANRASRAAAGWGGDRWSLLEKDGRQALVLATVWDSPNDAREFFDAEGLALKNRFSGARQEEASENRQALTAATNATDVRINGANVQVVLSFDRASADAIVALLPSS